jgi:hypothetical protein
MFPVTESEYNLVIFLERRGAELHDIVTVTHTVQKSDFSEGTF